MRRRNIAEKRKRSLKKLLRGKPRVDE